MVCMETNGSESTGLIRWLYIIHITSGGCIACVYDNAAILGMTFFDIGKKVDRLTYYPSKQVGDSAPH